MYIYLNGQVLSKEEAKISPYDHGFMYGIGAFETFRTYDGFPFLIDEHMKRLQEALIELNIQAALNTDHVIEAAQALLEKNNLDDAYFRLNVSAGDGDIGLQTTPYEDPTVILFTKPLPKPGASAKELVVLNTVRNTPEGRQRLKSHHYLNSILGKRELKDPVGQEGIFLTEQGFLSEGTVSNLFWVKANVLYTPAVSTGILNGITRKWVLHATEKMNIPSETGNYKRNELHDADEVILTNSIQELIPVNRFEHKTLPGADGPFFQKLKAMYREDTINRRRSI
ncbi:aminodeoxychorismate lyase [Fictibacillus phosphorivorans]|uniref:aminodeoxychorismate lyase n=1 Tax=Fictibacillus phosphorivorans TaxID=1221500 RepID=UPI00203B7860|nr:aminodeoxychorismate lyase [Fictibacillus phosphorivorans]MCM3719854.1 aminodeoxychorismate lyase [Fictibacillus phosphorivorans]MCM3777544.1 aminodeoxychorismate lyase [Fictibacillus phosphorivorans]